jgi:tetratricopeptide (TPR) repeat protein
VSYSRTIGHFRFVVLATVCAIWPQPAFSSDPGQGWIEIRSPHFVVLSNAGEKEGRRVAAQFEDIRGLFQKAFPKLRVDSGKPTIIFALKNEDSLKLFLPSYGLNRNQKRLAGLYQSTADKNFALLRTDVSGTGANAYHSLYHEYTHALLRVNYRGLPLWMDEGFAEFYGNSQFESKQASFGMPDATQLRILQREPLIPIGTLLTVDFSSPLYNAQEHSGMFYAESWALVHYFALSPEMRDQNLLGKFLAALQATDDPVEAANQSFGDLKKLAGKLESYARSMTFTYGRMVLQTDISEKDFAARKLEPAEALTAQADFLLRRGSPAEALNVLHQAAAADPKLAAVHDGLGYYHYLRAANDEAEKEFAQALAMDANDMNAVYYQAHLLLRQSGYTKETTPQIREKLEKVIAARPDFAPAHAFLCIAYIQSPETKSKAIGEAQRAMELEPGNMAYFIDLGKAVLALGRIDDANKVAERAQKTAMTPRDRAQATAFVRQITAEGKESGDKTSVTASVAAAEEAPADDSSEMGQRPQTSSVDGQITELICGHPPEVLLTLSSAKEQMLLHVKDISKIEIHVKSATSGSDVPACVQWHDRKATVTFRETPDGPAHGEIQSIIFE